MGPGPPLRGPRTPRVRAAAPGQPARGAQRGVLRARHGLPMAGPAQGLAPAQHRARRLRSLALRRHARSPPSRSLRANARDGGQGGQPHDGYRGQPERERSQKGGRRIDPVGFDAAQTVKGRKRHAVVDTLGLMLGCAVLPGNVPDRDGCLGVLKEVRRLFPFLERVVADGAYQGKETARAVRRAARAVLEIVKRFDAAQGFMVLPKRWIVECTFGWLGRCRRLAKDFEGLTRTHLAFVQLAMIRLMMRRIARASQTS